MNTLGETNQSNITKQDILNSIAFDKQGQYLAVGDRGGRVIVFRQIGSQNSEIDYDYFTEFQAHDSSFDFLNSAQIPEKVNAIEWINVYNQNSAQLLSANDKLIKLWKIGVHKEKKYESCKKLL